MRKNLLSAVLLTAVWSIGPDVTSAEDTPKNEGPAAVKKKSLTGQQILRLMGGPKGLQAGTPEQLEGYRHLFRFGDKDGDGKMTKKEYVEEGKYGTVQMRTGIFGAMDRDADDVVTEREYVENRQITDECKAIFFKIDKAGDGNGTVTEKEFAEHAPVSDKQRSKEIFEKMDTDDDRQIGMIECLRIWGDWARADRKRTDSPKPERPDRVGPPPGMGPPPGFGPPQGFNPVERFDRNKDGKLSKDEAPEPMRRLFERLGKDVLTAEDFARVRGDAKRGNAGRGDPSRFVQVFLMQNDANGDGAVDKSEFRGSDARFDQMDTNKNGKIEPAELKPLHESRMNDPKSMNERLQEGSRPPRSGNKRPGGGRSGGADSSAPEKPFVISPDGRSYGRRRFKRLDANQDGQVTAAEFTRSPGMADETKAKQVVERIDKDGDGTLSWTEFETVFRQRNPQGKKK